MKYAFLVSGALGLSVLSRFYMELKISCVLTDKNSGPIIDFCKEKQVPVFIGNPRREKAKAFIQQYTIDVLWSVNYLFIVEKDIIHWPKKYAINIHGSLLPKYKGRTPHVWAIINNEKVTGITAHLISKGCDEGDILHQREVPIGINDTGADLLAKFEQLYPKVIETVNKAIQENNLTAKPQNKAKGSFFGKRTPADGRINWHWQKERINNWIRAQAHPYPGAFTFAKGNKVIIHRIECVDYYFEQEQKNGFVLSTDPIRIKTPNGAIKLVAFSMEKEVTIKVGDVWQ